MALTKAGLSESIREKVRFKKKKRERQQYLFPEMDHVFLSKKRAMELVDSTFEIIKKRLEMGENILITGFGKFKVRFKWARKGRNPKTGEQIILNSHRVVTFQCSQRLRDKVNQKQRLMA
ncbi:MAG: integration host factor subunit alpha [Pseudomonadota bacterium]